jgi:hypothetical protein
MAPVSCRIYFHYDSRPSDDWTMNLGYDHFGTLADSVIDFQTLEAVNALQPFLLDNVIIDRFVWSTWVPDSAPYDPDAVRVIPIGLPGDRTFTLTSPVDDDLAYLIRKTVELGKAGRIYLKGALLTANVTAEGGAWTLVDGVVDDFEDWVLGLYNGLGSEMPHCLVGVSLLSTTYPATPEGVKQVPVKTYQTEPTIRGVTNLVGLAPTERQARQ